MKNMIDGFSSKERNNDLNIEYSDAEQQISYITMKIVAFLNARHYMVFADKKGKPHGHSWQLQAEARVPVKYNSFIKFEDLDKLLNKLLAPYQRSILNEVPPFDRIEPLTENISVYFFNSLYDALENLDVDLVRLSVWENPTKGIEITERLPQYFSSQDNKSVPASVIEKTLNEAAPGLDNADSLSTSPPPSNLEQDINEINGGILSGDEPISEELVTTDIIPEHNHPSEVTDRIDNEKQAESENAPHSSWPERVMERIKTYLSLGGSSVEEQVEHSPYPLWQIILAILVISGVAIWAYWPLLSAPLYKVYPWGSDTWGHLFKAQFLYREILNGNYYPQFMADWYNGCQPFRYWAPLPYYVLALLHHFTQNIFVAGNYYIFFCALLGGTGCLLLARRIGLWPAIMLGIIWLIWPDNVRIALSEGNLPRILATAFLPFLLYTFMEAVKDKKRVWPFLVTLIIIHIVILCHAMIGAIYIICLLMFGFLWWLFGGCSFTGLIRSIIAMILGVISSAWWLLPSLKGGLTSMGAGATGGIQYIAANISFNPVFRFTNREEFYWGITVLLVTLISITLWKKKPTWAKSLIIVGLFLVLLTFPAFSWLHQLLPLSQILWPLRFSTFASLALLVAAFAVSFNYLKNMGPSKKKWIGLLILSMFILLFLDSFYSQKVLMETRVEPYRIAQTTREIKENTGWRVVTLDLSSLGSSPSYLLSVVSHREQVFGWAWQGAATARNIMLLNTAMQNKYYPFLFRQLAFLGATDLMIKDSMLKDGEEFKKIAYKEGFRHQGTIEGVSYWKKDQASYFLITDRKCLGIGKYVDYYSLQFPSLETGYSNRIDDYDGEYLKQYPLIILAGAQWNQQQKAEKQILQYVASGGKVIVDMTGFPTDIMSRQPKFLGVYSEPVKLRGRITIQSANGEIYLGSFSHGNSPWNSLVPQPLDGVELSFDYMGNQAPLYGYKYYNGNKVWFLGANLAYHAFLTKEPAARHILQEIVQLPQEIEPVEMIPFSSYRSTNEGYQMSYQTDQAVDAIIPIAALDVMEARIDNERVVLDKFENLVRIRLPAGTHSINLQISSAPVYYWGRLISYLGLVLVLLYCVWMKFDVRGSRKLLAAIKKNGIGGCVY